jgi:hypothetical protein
MIGPGVDLQLGELLAGKAVTGEHPLHREADHFLRPPLEHVIERAGAKAARVTRVAVVHLRLTLVARHRDLPRVDDDHEVAGVDVRRVLGLALSTQDVGDLGRQPAERLAARIDQEPVSLAGCRCRHVGLHAGEQ